jgi:replicative superfamily II helicase
MESTINGQKTYISTVFPIIFPQPSAREGEICIDLLHLPGVGVHHAGLLPCYRRLVEQLTQDTAEIAEIVFLSGA